MSDEHSQLLQIAGARIAVAHHSPELRPTLDRLYRHAAVQPGGQDQGTASPIDIEVREKAVPEPSGESILELIADRLIRGWLVGDALILGDGRTTATIDYAAGTAQLVLSDTGEAARFVASRRLFPIALGELLRLEGRYPLHAAALDGPDGGVLALGDSGAGKSTLVYLSLAEGQRCVADDGVVLSREGASFAAHPLYREITVDPAVLRDRDRSRAVPSEPSPDHPKVRVDLSNRELAPRCNPRRILLLRRTGDRGSRIVACSGSEVIAELYRQHPWLSVYPPLAKDHLNSLAELTGQCSALIIFSGSDLFQECRNQLWPKRQSQTSDPPGGVS